MATWHQKRSGARLYHDTLWSVVSDPPNQCRAITLCATEHEAREYMERLKARGQDHVYILRPAGAPQSHDLALTQPTPQAQAS